MPPTDPDDPALRRRSLDPLAFPATAAGATAALARRIADAIDGERRARAAMRLAAVQDWTGAHRAAFDTAVVRFDHGLGDTRDALVRLAAGIDAAAQAADAENRWRASARAELAAERAAADAAHRRAEIGTAP